MSEQIKSAVERAKEYGIDVTLLESNLRKTPTELLEGLIAMMELYVEGQRLRRKQFGAPIVSDKISGYSTDPSKQ
ncbi:MAG: hypothetical protein ACRDGA_13585 [Bacteroidota bacterium]